MVASFTHVPPGDPRPLAVFSHHRRSRYRFVYPCGRDRWMATVRVGGVKHYLGTAATEREAAARAAGVLRHVYGPDWEDRHRAAVSAANRRPPRPYRVDFLPSKGVYRLTVYVRGEPQHVTPPGQAGFPDKPTAEAYYRRWSAGVFGLFAETELWREGGANSYGAAG
jgi:hypothetical protein